jgi:ribosome-associated protein
MIYITPNISLADEDISFTAVKASGPGGQHVNTTNSAVQLRFDAKNCTALNYPVYCRLQKLAGQRMTKDGVIVMQISDYRSQHRNKAVALERLAELIMTASIRPKPRRKTKPSKGSVQRRLTKKSHKSSLKKTRGRPSNND